MFSAMVRVRRVPTATSEGITSDAPGSSSTSSKVSPSRSRPPARSSLVIMIAIPPVA